MSIEMRQAISKAKLIDLVGMRYGKLIVVKKASRIGSAGQVYWDCICDCGAKHIVSGACLRHGKCKSCGCNRLVPPNKEPDRVKAIWMQIYKSTLVKRSRKKREYMDISFDCFKELSQTECYYCGLKYSNSYKDRNCKGKYLSDIIIKFNGIDRLDNSKGYLQDNVVPCCKFCNVAKNTMSKDEFLVFIKRVYKHNFI